MCFSPWLVVVGVVVVEVVVVGRVVGDGGGVVEGVGEMWGCGDVGWGMGDVSPPGRGVPPGKVHAVPRQRLAGGSLTALMRW